MTDVSPKLLDKIRESFESQLSASAKITELKKKVEAGTTTYKEVDQYAVKVGEILANAFKTNISSELLPDGKMYFNIAKAVVEPMLKGNHDLITTIARSVQENMNHAAGISMKAVMPEVNQDRINGIINRVSSEEVYDEVAWILQEPVINFSQSIVTDCIKANADFQHKAGLSPKIVRTSTGKCCKWCDAVAGTYEYPDVPKDVYRRHDYCRCRVDYICGKYKENVHNNHVGEKRKYVQDQYGGYELSREARIERSKQMASTEAERKAAAREKRIATWEKKKNDISIPDAFEDVKQEYLKDTSSAKGKTIIEPGVDRKVEKDAINNAETLSKLFGGDIEVLAEVNGQNVKTPDYMWRGRAWEQKTVSTARAVDSAIRKALHQIEKNPGGIVLDISNNKDNLNEIYKAIAARIHRRSFDNPIDIILIENKKIVSVIRHKKR